MSRTTNLIVALEDEMIRITEDLHTLGIPVDEDLRISLMHTTVHLMQVCSYLGMLATTGDPIRVNPEHRCEFCGQCHYRDHKSAADCVERHSRAIKVFNEMGAKP